MAVIETWLHQDLQEPVKVNHLDGNLFSNNGNGNRIGVVLTNNGEALASISGTVSGYVVTSDGSTVPCTGSKSGNRASILIPAAAYQPGSIFITVFVTDGTTVTTIGAVSTTVMRSRTNAQVDPGSAVTDWTQTINAAMQSVETAAANLGGIVAVPYASITFPVPLGKYTYYNNNLYRCITPIASSESFTAAHWTAAVLGNDVSDLKSATNQLIYILEYNSTGGGKTLPYSFENGYSYTVINGTNANMSCRTADSSGNDIQVISAGIASGSSYTFTANADAPNFKFHSGGSGTVSVVCNSTRVPVLEQNVISLQTGLQTTNVELSTFEDSVVQRVDIIKSTGGTNFAFKFEAGKRYIVYNGTNATMSCNTADSSNTNIETITGGMASDCYMLFTASQNAVRFKCYSGGSGKVSVWCVDTITGTADYNIETMSTWHGNVNSVNHRGFNFIAPENTIPAFILSRKNGFNIVESDVHFTSDGVAVMLHDEAINRTARNADGSEISSTINISDITYAQALTYDFGIWKGSEYAGTKIPTLDEFLVICKRLGLEVYIELKVPITQAQVNTVVEKVEKNGMRGKVSYICFSDQPLAYARDADNYARIGVLSGGINEGQIDLCEALRTGHNEVFISSSSYSSAEIALCVAAHVPLEIWTIDNPSTILNADPYISGVTSNSLVAGLTLLQMAFIS